MGDYNVKFAHRDGVACTEGLDGDNHRWRIRATPRVGSTPTAHVALPRWIFPEELCRGLLSA
jgi:hypothetical protein